MNMKTDQEIFEGAITEAIKRFAGREIVISTTIERAFVLIAMVQVGLRHPDAARTDSGHAVRTMIESLIEQIDPAHGDLWQLLTRGFDPAHDIELHDDQDPKLKEGRP